ncbi:methyltransferase domain-containing protein [Oryzobacter terrae]|uniref:methyltransferase domain-containing protein n=1 Tax=Oryzobacter terrae TaxID=1620385 RepID=UPI00366EAC54
MTAWDTDRPGAVVLAAYRPNPALFRVQLESIRDQTRGDYVCLIGADGDQSSVAPLVDEIVGADERFRVVGWDDNLGFYLNFERLLAALPDDVAWVALSDQDDRWHPDKLERLVPLLADVALATGQARVVEVPGQRVVARTQRRVVGPRDLLVQNQVTGSQTVFRRDLLDVALPFPRLRTETQLHDHWLAMCAVASEGYAVLDEVLQDYVQHGANLVGEVADRHPRTPWGVARLVRDLADRYEGGHRPAQLLLAAHRAGLGWRRLLANELAARMPTSATTLDLRSWIGSPGVLRGTRAAVDALRSRNVTKGTSLTLVAGLPGDVVASRRDRPHRNGQGGTDHEEVEMVSESAAAGTCWLCATHVVAESPYSAVGFSRCPACGLLFQPTRASAEEEAQRYDASYFDAYSSRTGGQDRYDEHDDQRRAESRGRLDFVRTHVGTTSQLLEVGAASGWFVEAARDAGWQAVGVEPSAPTAAEGRRRGVDVWAGTLADAATKGAVYDAVCAWHVLEHLPQPREAVAQLISLVRPGGWLFLELPNLDSVAAHRGGLAWVHLDADAHVAHYGPRLVQDLLTDSGLDVRTVETFSVRAFTTRRLRRAAHAVFDTLVLRTPPVVHPSRHELMRVAARRPLEGP